MTLDLMVMLYLQVAHGFDTPDWSAPVSMYCNRLLCPKNTKPSALSLQAACHSKSPVYSKTPPAMALTTDIVPQTNKPVTIYSKPPYLTTDKTQYTEAYKSTVRGKLHRTDRVVKNINYNMTRMHTTDSANNLTCIQSYTLDNITKNTNKTENENAELDVEQYVYMCVIAVAKRNMSTTPAIISNHCIIPMDKFKQFLNGLRTWFFFQENCFYWDIRRKEVIKFAFYYNVGENTCMSVPTDGIPVGVKTGKTEALCYIPVDVNGKGMFTIDAQVFSSACSSEVNVDHLIKRSFHIYPFPKYQKVYTNSNIKADLFNIRTCRIIYDNSTEDKKIPSIKTRHSCLAFMRSGQISNPMSQNLLARRCQVAESPTNEKYLILVPERMCAKVIQRSVCLVC